MPSGQPRGYMEAGCNGVGKVSRAKVLLKQGLDLILGANTCH